MSVEQLDDLAGRGALAGVSLFRAGDLWEARLQSATTGGWAVLRKPTPSEALAAVMALLPVCEAYDITHGLAQPVEHPEDNCACGGGDASRHASECPEAAEPAGIFD
jgi:hypothetical protein